MSEFTRWVHLALFFRNPTIPRKTCKMVQVDAEHAAEKLVHIEKIFTAIQLNKNQPGHKLA